MRGDPGEGGANSKGLKGDRGEFGIPGSKVKKLRLNIKTINTTKNENQYFYRVTLSFIKKIYIYILLSIYNNNMLV